MLAGGASSRVAPPDAGEQLAPAPVVDSYKYVGFEDRFRGSQDDIRARLRAVRARCLPAPRDVLDVGCGRGELLDLLRGRRDVRRAAST